MSPSFNLTQNLLSVYSSFEAALKNNWIFHLNVAKCLQTIEFIFDRVLIVPTNISHLNLKKKAKIFAFRIPINVARGWKLIN